jgi:hypothetical protein
LHDASENQAYVFLYRNKDGIIAGGIATRERGFEGRDPTDPDGRRAYVRLREFVHGIDVNTGEVRASITPRELRELIDQRLFIGTVVHLSEESARRLYGECARRFR